MSKKQRQAEWRKIGDKATKLGIWFDMIISKNRRRQFKFYFLDENGGFEPKVYFANGKKEAMAFLDGVEVGEEEIKKLLARWGKNIEFEEGINLGGEDGNEQA